MKLTADPAWAEAVAAAPVCLEHLVALMGVRPAPAHGPPSRSVSWTRLGELRDLLDGYSYTSSYDRRQRQTDAQRASPDLAAALLAGGARERARGRGRRVIGVGDAAGCPRGRADRRVRIRQDDDRRRDRRSPGRRGVPSAAIDLDWLGWHSAPGIDEHEDPRLDPRQPRRDAGDLPRGRRPVVRARLARPRRAPPRAPARRPADAGDGGPDRRAHRGHRATGSAATRTPRAPTTSASRRPTWRRGTTRRRACRLGRSTAIARWRRSRTRS